VTQGARLSNALKKPVDHLKFVVGEIRDKSVKPHLKLTIGSLDSFRLALDQLNDHAAPVIFAANTPNETSLLKAVDGCGCRSGGDPEIPGQCRGRDRFFRGLQKLQA